MLTNAPIIAFAAITDPERARSFYEGALGLTFVRDEPYALVFDAAGTVLRLSKVQVVQPAPYSILGWSVPDIELAVTDLSQRGVAFERFEGIPQDPSGICAFPDGTRVAWFKDPDGNLLGVTQFG